MFSITGANVAFNYSTVSKPYKSVYNKNVNISPSNYMLHNGENHIFILHRLVMVRMTTYP